MRSFPRWPSRRNECVHVAQVPTVTILWDKAINQNARVCEEAKIEKNHTAGKEPGKERQISAVCGEHGTIDACVDLLSPSLMFVFVVTFICCSCCIYFVVIVVVVVVALIQ